MKFEIFKVKDFTTEAQRTLRKARSLAIEKISENSMRNLCGPLCSLMSPWLIFPSTWLVERIAQ
jgi:hypothetical protein